MQRSIQQQLHLTLCIQGITNLAGASTYYAHESGADQVNSSGTTSIDAYILSGDLDIDDGESILIY
jgi:hypothetical protein